MKRNLQNDKLVMKIIRKQTCKMITQDYDKSVSKKQESGLKWLIIFLGKVCISCSIFCNVVQFIVLFSLQEIRKYEIIIPQSTGTGMYTCNLSYVMCRV